ncbi:type I restriction endonuclease [Bacteroidales bacterium SW299]|nr:type I restriction endonuclease [Bacteroidales bacterium SW299]
MDTKKLRQKILDLAIHGKLVPQDPNDEPASVLLEHIKVEKERLIKEGKIKKSKKSAKTSDTPHYPYLLPKGWEWCKLEDIAYVASGSTPSKESFVSDGIPYIKMYNLRNQKIDFDFKPQYIKPEVHNGKLQRSRTEVGDLIMNIVGPPLGKLAIIPSSLPQANFNQAAVLIRPLLHKAILTKYLFYYLSEMSEIKSIATKGSAGQVNISLTQSQNMRIPLPPLSEQNRIIVEIEYYFDLISTIEQSQSDLQVTIKQTKRKILDLAIHGKLVSQDPNDEPASELLKCINPKAEITCDNGHYENLPDSWCLTDIKSIFTINPKNKVADDVIAGFVPMINIADDYSNEFRFESKLWGDIKKGFTHFADGDIVVAKISPCLENRKSVIVTSLPNGIGAGTTELFVFRSQYILPEYGLYFFKSDSFINNCAGTFNGVVGQQRVSKSIIENIKFPLPPISEQRRIVDAVHKVFAKLDAIMENL